MIVTAGTFSSCLKDSATTVDFTNAKGSLELPATAYSGILQPQALDIQSTPTPISLMVNLSGAKPSGSNTTATLAVDQNALTAYNSANSTNYTLLPQAAYSIPSLSVAIPAGQRSANLIININTSVIDPSQQYILPLTIVDGGGQQINPQYKTVLFNVQVKNKYDGVYKTTGTRVHPTLGAFPFSYNVTMSTTGASSISGSALADLKSDLKITVNADNSVSLSSIAQPSVALTPGGVNKYDPATKTFTLSYYYNSAAPRYITQVLVKQ